jgi:hypothetical protein
MENIIFNNLQYISKMSNDSEIQNDLENKSFYCFKCNKYINNFDFTKYKFDNIFYCEDCLKDCKKCSICFNLINDEIFYNQCELCKKYFCNNHESLTSNIYSCNECLTKIFENVDRNIESSFIDNNIFIYGKDCFIYEKWFLNHLLKWNNKLKTWQKYITKKDYEKLLLKFKNDNGFSIINYNLLPINF